jgi:hypothetical protein
MNPGADRSTLPAFSAHVVAGGARSQLGPQVVAASAIAAVAVATLAWQAAFAGPAAEPLEQVAVTGTAASGSAAARTGPVGPIGPTSSGALNAVAPRDVPPAIAPQLQALSSAHEQLQQHARATDERLSQLEAELASLRQQVQRSRVAQLKAHRQAQALARQLRSARAAAETQAVHQALAAKVLSVDTWAGRPSVSVQVGAEVRFFAEGDVVANALLRKADPATQRVEFVSAAGEGLPIGGSVEQRQ